MEDDADPEYLWTFDSAPSDHWNSCKHCMQRRMHRSLDAETPPKSPFIRPHLSTISNGSSIISKKTLSSAARIWVLVVAFGLLFTITRLFSSKDSQKHSFYNQDALHPINYLNQTSSLAPPFAFCPVHGSMDVIGNKYGAHAMAKSRLHLGSGARVQRLIHRVRIDDTFTLWDFIECPFLIFPQAMSGQPVTISVLGGSSKYTFQYPFICR